jgi:ADP-ribose pyrophosphatase YjhB (NUDIX family)
VGEASDPEVERRRRNVSRHFRELATRNRPRVLARVRRDHLHEPAAPVPQLLAPGAGGAVFDEQGRILLVRRRDNGRWALPGGQIGLTESVSGAVVREIAEETGLRVEVTGLIGVYSDPQHVVSYTSGEVRREFFLLCRCRLLGGALRLDEESTDVRFFALEDALGLPLTPGHRQRIEDAFGGRPEAVVR